ncbi:MAG TPA: hypothetical protein VEL47_04320, partial [Myxococcota bacterium]|nr:hypothetical protein [Myxococcota bacterium]
MKNVKNLLMAAVAFLSVGSLANLIQPAGPVSEEAPLRISIAGTTGLIKNANGYGLNNLGGGIGFAHNVGYDFQWGLAASWSWANVSQKRILVESEDTKPGNRLDVELIAAFMPEIAEHLYVGGIFGLGWGKLWSDASKQAAEHYKIAFGDLSLRLGPAL